MPIVRSVSQLRDAVRRWRRKSRKIALVPTMGGLHEGHLSLVRIARKNADRVIVSSFVNPTQFGPDEDFDNYPRDEHGDNRLLAKAGTDLVYAPSILEMYPGDFATRVEVAELTQCLCGVSRPHFFAGVTTVVTKLFLQSLPDIAVFGEKDYQQLLVIRQLVKDLNFPIEILSGPIVRESDGLAMSSRNAYLSEEDRATAPQLYNILSDMAADLSVGRDVESTISMGVNRLRGAGFRIDYLDVRTEDTLIPLEGRVVDPARIFAAVHLGNTRLIDNVPIEVIEDPVV
ncbi:MAG: pantoate--beta-alanine ligase [Dichotomicrobium sp.]